MAKLSNAHYDVLQLAGNKYAVKRDGKSVAFNHNQWFCDVIKNTLNGKAEEQVNNLTEKQIEVFGRNMQDEPSNGLTGRNQQFYITNDGIYCAVLTHYRKHADLQVTDFVQRSIESRSLWIENLKSDLANHIAEGKTEQAKEDEQEILELLTEIEELEKSKTKEWLQ